jgi:outer membrane protein assembly factor BamD (BamD/ComL family)
MPHMAARNMMPRFCKALKSYYEDFKSRYAQAAEDIEIAQTLDLIKEQLAYKDYAVGFYYERTGKTDSATMYYNRVIAEWPDSKACQMAQARLAPDAPPAIKMTVRRKAADFTGLFLDSWFGIRNWPKRFFPKHLWMTIQRT